MFGDLTQIPVFAQLYFLGCELVSSTWPDAVLCALGGSVPNIWLWRDNPSCCSRDWPTYFYVLEMKEQTSGPENLDLNHYLLHTRCVALGEIFVFLQTFRFSILIFKRKNGRMHSSASRGLSVPRSVYGRASLLGLLSFSCHFLGQDGLC